MRDAERGQPVPQRQQATHRRLELPHLLPALAAITRRARLPGSLLVFDVVPEVMLDMVRRTSGRERDLAVELWTWLFNPGERAAISAIPGVEELRDLAPPLKRGLASLGIAGIGRLPRRLRYSLPVFQVLQARFRAVSAH
jgi:hypothetical protein